MRGKHILCLAFIAILLGVPLLNVGYTEELEPYDATISADPQLVTGLVPPETFEVDLVISWVEGLYAFEVAVNYPPAMRLLSVVSVAKGDFWTTAADPPIVVNVNAFEGLVWVGGTQIGDIDGLTGEGSLATVTFTILEAGEATIDVNNGRITTHWEGDEEERWTVEDEDGYFLGPTADLYNAPGSNSTGPGNRGWKAGDTRKFKAIAENTGYAGLWVRGKYTTVNKLTGDTMVLYSGQSVLTSQPRTTEYYYVNEFAPVYWQDWDTIGTDPYLDADDESYIEGHNHCEIIGMFGFEDITLNPGDMIASVSFEGLTQADSDGMDFDLYDIDFAWYGSLWGTTSWSWMIPRWELRPASEINPALKTEAGFNSFAVLIHAYAPSVYGRLDALRLRVEFTGIEGEPIDGFRYLAPGEILPMYAAVWDLYSFDEGIYDTTMEIEYQYYTPDPRFPQTQWPGKTVISFTWYVRS